MRPLATTRVIRSVVRSAALAVFSAGAAFLCLPAAHGAPASVTQLLPLADSSWFWTGALGGPLPNADPTVPSGDLAVSGPTANGQPPAETYLRFDLTGIPAGSTITSLALQLPVDSTSTFPPVGTAAPMVVCTPEASWSSSTGPQPFSQKPAESCAVQAPLLKSASNGQAYKVDIASIAQPWVGAPGSNFGIAVTDDPQNSSTAYQIAFGPAAALKQVEASVTYTLPEAAAATTLPPATTVPGTVPVSVPTAPLSTPTPAVVPPVVTPSSVPSPGLAVPPVTATTTTTLPATPAAVKTPATAGSTPPAGFWIAGLLLAAVIATCWYELGRAPARAEVARRGGVSRLLAQRKA